MSVYLVWTSPTERTDLGRVVHARSANEAARIASGGKVRHRDTIGIAASVATCVPAGTRLYIPIDGSRPVVNVLLAAAARKVAS